MTTTQGIKEQAQAWMSEHLAGMTPARMREFERWLSQSPDHGAALASLQSLWDELGWDETLNAEALAMDPAGQALSPESWTDRLAALVDRFDGWLAGGVAAGLAAVVTLMFVMPALQEPMPAPESAAVLAEVEQYATRVGEIREVALADGTHVTLGGATAIEVRMFDDRRELRMVHGGDALFEVAHDPDRPFRVDAGRVSATVLGTVFEINSASAAETVSVVEGRVRVEDAGRRQVLGAGERVTAQAGRDWTYETFNADHAARWIETRMVFRDAPLGQIVEDVNRYYPAGVRLEGEGLERLRVTSSFRIDQLGSALSGIALSHGLKVEGDASEGFILSRDDSSQ